jgi:hypothetical protein
MRWLPGRSVGVIALGNSTYVPMSMMARRMVEILDDHGLVPDASCEPSAALVHAAHHLAALLSNWTDEAASELFADNVALDQSFARRAHQAGEMMATHGTLAVETVAAVTPMRGQATMRHADGIERKFDIELSPLVPPRLQLYELVEG